MTEKTAPWDRVVVAVVTLGGAGFAPVAPGTFGTIVAFVLHLGLLAADFDSVWTCVTLAISSTVVSMALTPRAEHLLGEKDPGSFVLDELAGYFVAVSFAGWRIELWEAAAAFVLFRLFDITKPPPIRRLEKLGGHVGVTVDDLMAGMYAGLCVAVATAVLSG